jgi:carbonic anhydrase
MKNKFFSYFVITGLTFFSLIQTSASEENKTVGDIMNNLISHDNKFVNQHSKNYFDKIKDKQNPSITLLTCSDSRINENIFEDDPTNKIFSVRNIGNQFSTSIGSVDYGVKNLKTKVLIIMGHSHCGAIHTAMSDYQDETFAIMRDIDHLFVPVRKVQDKYQFNKNDSEKNWARIVEENVDYQILLATKKYQDEVDKNKLYIIGLVHDLSNEYKSGQGRTIVVNINNIKDTNKIKKHLIMSNISNDMKNMFVKRLNTIKL